MKQYHALFKEVLGNGDVMLEPRTQVYTIGMPGSQSVYDLREGFPLVTTKKVNPRLPFEELFWKLRGERSVKPLFDKNVHIWDENAFQHYLKREGLTEKMPKHSEAWEEGFKEYRGWLESDPRAVELGDLGPVYGYQWRHGFERGGEEIDQLKNVIDGVKKNPGSRYHLMTAWNPSDLPDSALGPCPMTHHFHVFGYNLDLHVFQRSCDILLGVPFNIAQDSLLLQLVAKETDLVPRKFVHTYSSAHIYLGVPPRAEFWAESSKVRDFQRRFNDVTEREDYLGLLDWYLANTLPEGELHEGKDHVPTILMQLSKEPRQLSSVDLKGVPFWEAIEMKVKDVVTVNDYDPHVWDSKARMAV